MAAYREMADQQIEAILATMLTLCVCTNLVTEGYTDEDKTSVRKALTSNNTRSSYKDLGRSQ